MNYGYWKKPYSKFWKPFNKFWKFPWFKWGI